MNTIISKFKSIVQFMVDKYNGRKIDYICYFGYIVSGILSIYFGTQIYFLALKPIVYRTTGPIIYSVALFIPSICFFLSLAGDKLKVASSRISQFVYVVITTSIIILAYLTEVMNIGVVGMFNSIKHIDKLPLKYIVGNIRITTFFMPTIVVIPLLFKGIQLLFDEDIRKVIREFEVELLLPNIYKTDETSIDIEICIDDVTGEKCVIPEKKLYEQLWIQGGTGSGKTATILRPYINQLFDKKRFLLEFQKKIALECLENNLCYINSPITNKTFNENFTMDYITPYDDKREDFIKKFKDNNMLIGVRDEGKGEIIYKNLGLTVIAPDGGLPKDVIKIAEAYKTKVHKIDPSLEEIEKGGIAKINPLKGGRPDKIGDIVSSILISMENTSDSKGNPYFINASVRAVRNVTILLKVMYPRIYNYDPTLEDVLHTLNDFNSVVPLVEEMKADESLRNEWGSVIQYFETSFYPPEIDSSGKVIVGSTTGSQRKKTEEAIGGIINQLDNFIGRPEIRYILCDRENSLSLTKIIEKGECIAIATRQSNLGERLGKAFSLFFILSLQTEILSRYSEDENPEIPHFLIMDEFPMYLNEQTKIFFTFARKYKCSVAIAIQNMGQLKEVSDTFGETIFTNTDTKILLPKSNVEDRKYWAEYFGTKDKVVIETGITTTSIVNDSPRDGLSIKGKLQSVNNVSEQEVNELNFKHALYSFTNLKGRTQIGKGSTDFLDLDKYDKTKVNEYDFEKYIDLDILNTRDSVEEVIETNIETSKAMKENKGLTIGNSRFSTIENFNNSSNNFIEANNLVDIKMIDDISQVENVYKSGIREGRLQLNSEDTKLDGFSIDDIDFELEMNNNIEEVDNDRLNNISPINMSNTGIKDSKEIENR